MFIEKGADVKYRSNFDPKNISDVVESKLMQNVLDFFSESLGVSLLCVYNNNWLTLPSCNTDFCHKLSTINYKHCEKCHHEQEKATREKCEIIYTECYAGLSLFSIPIIVNGEYMASVAGGQILTTPPNEEHCRRIAKELAIDEEEYFALISKIKIFSPEKVKGIAELLSSVTNLYCAVAYANIRLDQLGLDYELPTNIEAKKLLISHYENAERPLSALEIEILKAVVEGKSNAEIAQEFLLNEQTVRNHLVNFMEKFDAEDRVKLAIKVVKTNIV